MAAQEHEGADVARRRRRWFRWILPWLSQRLPRLVLIDETAVSTKIARLRGRAVHGRRLKAKAPYAKWGTQTFIAALRAEALTAPWVIYSPDLNPIEMAFAKLKAQLRATTARTPDTLIAALGRVCGLFEPNRVPQLLHRGRLCVLIGEHAFNCSGKLAD